MQSTNRARGKQPGRRDAQPTKQAQAALPDHRKSTAQLHRLGALIDGSPRLSAQAQIAALANSGAAPAVMQPVWKNSATFKGGTLEWDAVINKLKWYYDTASDRYFYVMDYDSSFQDLDPAVYRQVMDGQYVHRAPGDVLVPPAIVAAPPGNVGETHITDPLGRACLRALSQEDFHILIPALADELKASKPDDKGIEDMAKGVMRETDGFVKAKGWTWQNGGKKWGKNATYVTCDDEKGIYRASQGGGQLLVDECRRAIFKQVGGRMEDEAGFPKADASWAVGIQREAVNVGGIMLHFTNRTDKADSAVVCERTAQLIDLIRRTDPAEWARTIITGLGLNIRSTLRTLQDTTGVAPQEELQGTVAEALDNEKTAKHIPPLCEATQKRWAAALNGNIHIVIDRARMRGADGSSTYNEGATPQNLLSGTAEGLEVGQRISINLDSAPIQQVIITIAHELGHAIGFNPTGIDAHGHFKDLAKYLEAEKGLGPKMLYDAYFFETMVRLLM